MIRYDWNVIRNLPMDDILRILFVLTDLNDLKQQPRRIIEVISRFTDYSSFLLNPRELVIQRRKYVDADMYLYLELASMRSYNNYKYKGSIRLPTNYFKEDIIEKIIFNSLLEMTNGELIFIYEEK